MVVGEFGGIKMTLETLAKDIAASAEADVKALIDEAKNEAKKITDEAKDKASKITGDANTRAEREASQISREVVASARQANQKAILIAKREAMDSTHAAVKEQLADPGFKGRASMLKSLMAKADKMATSDFVIRPVEVDRKALGDLKGKRKVGESVDGLGGFILEAADGSVSFDMRFDTMLETAWNQSLSEVNKILFE
jgi:V/A-type H+-transporting ATPase subunit E